MKRQRLSVVLIVNNMKLTVGKLKTIIKEAMGEPYDMDDRSGRDDVAALTTPDAITSVVETWYEQHRGKIDDPASGNRTSIADIVPMCIEMLTVDRIGAAYQIEERLRDFDIEARAARDLAQELYKLVAFE